MITPATSVIQSSKSAQIVNHLTAPQGNQNTNEEGARLNFSAYTSDSDPRLWVQEIEFIRKCFDADRVKKLSDQSVISKALPLIKNENTRANVVTELLKITNPTFSNFSDTFLRYTLQNHATYQSRLAKLKYNGTESLLDFYNKITRLVIPAYKLEKTTDVKVVDDLATIKFKEKIPRSVSESSAVMSSDKSGSELAQLAETVRCVMSMSDRQGEFNYLNISGQRRPNNGYTSNASRYPRPQSTFRPALNNTFPRNKNDNGRPTMAGRIGQLNNNTQAKNFNTKTPQQGGRPGTNRWDNSGQNHKNNYNSGNNYNNNNNNYNRNFRNTNNNNNNNKTSFEGRCFHCSRMGHRISECKTLQNSQNGRPRQNNFNRQNNQSNTPSRGRAQMAGRRFR